MKCKSRGSGRDLKIYLVIKTKENAISFDKRNAIKKRAIQLRNENPEFYIYQIEAILAKEFNVSKSSLQKIKKLVPKRAPKKKNP